MSDLISRDNLDSFFYSETSGTDEMIEDAVMKYSDMEMNFPDDCRALCKDIIEMCRNVIRTEPTAYDLEKAVDSVRITCYTMGLDESQTEILVDDVRKGGVE